MREKVREYKLAYSFLVFLAVAIITFGSTATATDISWEYGKWCESSGCSYIEANSTGNKVMQFTILDGGDTVLVNSTVPGDDLYSFEDNRTMFVNQSFNSTSGLQGFDPGDDIFRISLRHTEGVNETISNSTIQNFSTDTLYLDQSLGNNGSFDGDKSVSNNLNESIIRDNGSNTASLDNGDFVISGGLANTSLFWDNITYTDTNGNSVFDGGSEAIIQHSSSADSDRFTLEEKDTVLREGAAGLTVFSSSMKFVVNNSEEDYVAGNAIIENDGANIYDDPSKVITNGTANLHDAGGIFMSYYNGSGSSITSFSNTGEPIYYDNETRGFVNESEIRLGEVVVKSAADSKRHTIDLNLTSMSKVNATKNGTADNEVGEDLYPVWSNLTSYGSEGSFWVYEFSDNGGAADGIWNPGEGTFSGDQDTLIYNIEGGSDITSGDVLLYDEHANNSNLSLDVGDEFNSSTVYSNGYNVSADVGFNDSDGDGVYDPLNETVLVNTTYNSSQFIEPNSSVIQISNRSKLPNIASSPAFVSTGTVKFWNSTKSVSGYSDAVFDGLFIDMNGTGNVSHGDLRLGEWSTNESAGPVEKEDMDRGVDLEDFKSTDNVKIINSDLSSAPNVYTPADGTRDNREPIIRSRDSFLNSTDSIIRSGFANFGNLENENGLRYIDSDQDGLYRDGDAIVQDKGGQSDVLEDEDEVVVSGNASLDNFSESTWHIETGEEQGFEKYSNESIIHDGDQDGVLERGNLSLGDNYVVVPGKANLKNFTQPPSSEGGSGLVYVDSNSTERYNYGEDILHITLLRNSSVVGNISGETIYNFANTTRHSGNSVYHKGNAIVNDTDDNNVYEDIFKGIGVENVYKASSYFKQNLTDSELQEGEIDIYRAREGEDKKVGALTSSGSLRWDGSFSENITEDTTFYLAIDIVSSGLKDLVYGMKFESYSINMAGNSLTLSDCSEGSDCTQRILDNHAPELNSSHTGFSKSGNSSQRDKIFIEVLEVGAGLSNTFDYRDFNISSPKYEVIRANIVDGSNNIRLTLNDTLETNETPKVSLAKPSSIKENKGAIKDDANNFRGNHTTETRDGLRPLIEGISYLDEDVDGTLDMLEVVFSERVNYTRFDASGWKFKANGVPCIQALAPGHEASFCSTRDRIINVTSGSASSVFRKAAGLSSMQYVNESNKDSSEYEIGGELYNVTETNTDYGGNGSFVVHEFNTSEGDADGVWNPNSTGDQDVVVYSVNDTNITPGDVLIYDENQSNDNLTVSVGEEFSVKSVKDSADPYNSYRVNTTIGHVGTGSYDPLTHNVSVNVSYNSSDFDKPNSTFVSLVPGANKLGINNDFNQAGKVKFWNTSGAVVEPTTDGLFIDMNGTGNISHGDVRLGEWTIPERVQLYKHKITSEVDVQTAGSALNNTLINLSTSKYDSMSFENIINAEIANASRKLNVAGNITSINTIKSGHQLNISFNTSKYDINLSESDQISISYYSQSNVTRKDVDAIEINSKDKGSVYDGIGELNQINTSVVEINSTALEGITGTSGNEPVVNFTVLNNLVSDLSGNTLTNTSESINLSDEAGPAVIEAATGDADNDARIDAVELNFSEKLDDSGSVYSSAFNLSNGTILQTLTNTADDSELTLNVTDIGGTSFTPNLTVYNNTIRDSSGNSIDVKQNYSGVKDGANPILMNAEIDSVKSNSDHTFIDMQFSEKTLGKSNANESINISGQVVEFKNTDSSTNLSVNYTEQLQTGKIPNISVVNGLRDDSGNQLEKFESSLVQVNTFRRELVEGWNYVSIPLAKDYSYNITDLIDSSKLEVVWTRRNGSWITFDPEAPSNDFKEFKSGKGYLVKSNKTFLWSVNVFTPIDLDSGGGSSHPRPTRDLDQGWNLVGHYQEFNLAANQTEDSNPPGAFATFSNGDLSYVYEQDEAGTKNVTQITDQSGSSGGSMVNPGSSYWLLAENNATYSAVSR